MISLPTVPYYQFYKPCHVSKAKYVTCFTSPVNSGAATLWCQLFDSPLGTQVIVLLTSKCLFPYQGWHCVPELWYTKVPSKYRMREVLEPVLKRAH